ncbi:hypothetical protein GIB67_010198 [Kingdonia uniflora]|uniref:FAR1 domain-containing protein n=1 Tax=Kingdonia uniflora TaxID=39325 RepID=A0A7J7NBJ6_9MAGN|nr:hypothetical protein GIB67_010198 [Kingdonia uniflora]
MNLTSVETCDDNVIDEVADVGNHDQHINVDLSQFNNMVYEGMVCDSEEVAFKKYNEFARKVGFSVRKDKIYKRADGSIKSRMFVCFKQGLRKEDKRCKNTTKVSNESRTDCKARMIIKNEEDEWTVSKIVYEHNHVLATPSKAYMLRSQRKVKEILTVAQGCERGRPPGTRLKSGLELSQKRKKSKTTRTDSNNSNARKHHTSPQQNEDLRQCDTMLIEATCSEKNVHLSKSNARKHPTSPHQNEVLSKCDTMPIEATCSEKDVHSMLDPYFLSVRGPGVIVDCVCHVYNTIMDEEAAEADNDYYQMWQFHHVIMSGEQRRVCFHLLAEDVINEADEEVGVHPRKYCHYLVSDWTL